MGPPGSLIQLIRPRTSNYVSRLFEDYRVLILAHVQMLDSMVAIPHQ